MNLYLHDMEKKTSEEMKKILKKIIFEHRNSSQSDIRIEMYVNSETFPVLDFLNLMVMLMD